jgi:D-galacturonate reductase
VRTTNTDNVVGVINPTHDAQAIGSMKPGDVAIIFTPDDTHFAIASAAITAGLHVLVAKPIVKNLQEHKQLVALAKRHNVLVRA